MRRSEAPPPGWYPDPTGRSGLLWWDGLDWTTHHRPLPVAGSEEEASVTAQQREPAHGDEGRTRGAARHGTRPMASVQRRRHAEREVTDAVAEARRVARAEVERAVRQTTTELTRVRDEWQPRVAAYLRRSKRWLRVVAVVVVVLVALSAWSSATLQTSLLEWLGERVDAVSSTVAPRPPGPPTGGG